MKGWQALPEERCGNCEYFCKHYLRSFKGGFRPTTYGHCVHPRLKNRRAEEQCPHWTPAGKKSPRSP